MNLTDLKKDLRLDEMGNAIHALMSELYPICRSITGNGLRQSIRLLQKHIPLTVHEVPTGTEVFDWTVPKEWNIREAYVKNSAGERVVDFKKCNLHVVSYSAPVRRRMLLEELKPHLFTLPEHPDWIPYRTSYYNETWGFCLTQNQLSRLDRGDYEVCIESSLEEGHLTYGEYFISGNENSEVLISSHVCHPSLCNDNLSGVTVATFLAKHLSQCSLRYSYRFLFIPGTIGSITWLSLNEAHVPRIKHGLVLTCLGDAGNPTYKKSRRGDAEIDNVFLEVLRHSGQEYEVQDFFPYGYDERQYCSPGFNLPVGCFMRTPHGRFPEYHTSADNLEFVRPEYLADSLSKCVSVIDLLETNRTYVNQNPKCEPQLGKRGLYKAIGGAGGAKSLEMAMLWVLNLSDGAHSLLDIARRASLEFAAIREAASLLEERGLLQEVGSTA